ncbi:pyridine nucleotide-disulfide oxidoreductase family protein [Klebsiella pneumoniae]|nr:pyridine nucleotide-disulfide oxidoreductase family protein [Klebsiella pneumoniae]
MVACPFGVMQVVVTPQAAGLVKASAHKCDLCQGREAGPACVENCPAQALTLADDETLITLAKQRRLRSACQEVQPWQRATPLCSQPNAGAKVRQMAMTPPRGEPDKLAAEVRKSHFEEIYQPFTPEQAQQQAARCLTCGEHSIANGPARCITISRSGLSWLKRGISPPRSRFPIRPTACRRSLAASVPRTGCVKAPAPCAMKAGQSPSAY